MVEITAQRLSGRIAIVTGGASGIGEATARTFAAHGATVIIADVAAERGMALANEIGNPATFLALDVADPGAWAAVIDEVVRRFGRIDVLVNNAGIGGMTAITDERPEQHHRMLDINLTGVWAGIRAVVPAMKAAGGGSIVNISSIDGLVGVAHNATYVASKFAVTGLTRSLALELGEHGIRVNSVHPGITRTPIMPPGPLMPRLQQAIDRQPIKRIGQPQDIANAVLFFASDESAYCTGSSLVVDGGHIAGPYRDPIST